MSNILLELEKRGLVHPPSWLSSNVHYLTITGSVAYGVSSDTSDMDLYGFCTPKKEIIFPHLAGKIHGFDEPEVFDQWQEHHIVDQSALGGKGREYDFSVYNIVRYFYLLKDNNPNMIDSIYTSQECVLHATAVANMVRENRDIFLHKACYPKFKRYAYSQLHKMTGKNPIGKRKKQREEFGFDCYLEEDTEFLTDSGWKKFDEISKSDRLATLNGDDSIYFEPYVAKIDKLYSGNLYTFDHYMGRFAITENHNILVSPAHRNVKNNFSYKYDPQNSAWQLIPLSEVLSKSRSYYHIRRCLEPRICDFNVEDSYLKLSGMYIAEGTIQFRANKKGVFPKCAVLSQTKNGKEAFFVEADNLGLNASKVLTYDYEKESKWVFDKSTADRLFNDYGHGSLSKRLPKWMFSLSYRQAKLFWDALWLGDGTDTPNGDVYYTNNRKLADDIQAVMIAAGHLCTVRGPYTSISSFTNTEVDSYQIYLSKESKFSCVYFKEIKEKYRRHKRGQNIKKEYVENKRVVCFEVPGSVLITRNNGKVAIQGNCKFAYHLIRLLNECEQILAYGTIDLRQNNEQLKAIRRGEVNQDEVIKMASAKEKQLEELYSKTKLPDKPQNGKIKQLLLNCLEHHYGNLSKVISSPDKYRDIVDEIKSIFDRNSI